MSIGPLPTLWGTQVATKKKNQYGYEVGGSSSTPGDSGSFGSNPVYNSIIRGTSPRTQTPKAYSAFQPQQAAYSEGKINAGTPAVRPSGPPSPGLDTQQQRLMARQGFAFDMGDINRRLMEAAMNYGNLDKVTQYGLDPQGHDTSSLASVTKNPNSVWANIGRYQQEHDRSINEDLNNRGSFFSGANLVQHQNLNDDVSRQHSQAALDWSSTEAQLLDAILQARAGRDNSLMNADLQDLAAAAARAPVGNPGPAPSSAQASYQTGLPVTPNGVGGPPYVYPMGSAEDLSGLNIGYTPLPFAEDQGAGALGSFVGGLAHKKKRR